jgi:hypothetical protein
MFNEFDEQGGTKHQKAATSAYGTFETCQPALTMSTSGENRKSWADRQNDANDPKRKFTHHPWTVWPRRCHGMRAVEFMRKPPCSARVPDFSVQFVHSPFGVQSCTGVVAGLDES